MVSDRDMIRVFMARLIERAGGVDAASVLVSARLGRNVCKGTISRRMSGDLDWPLVEIIALEDVVGDPCVRRWLCGGLPEAATNRDLLGAVAASAREHGEALAAALAVGAGGGDMAVAKRELSEAAQALTGLLAALELAGGAS